MEANCATKNSPLFLWWLNPITKKYLSAGVAFYDEKFGEYRLKIDIHPENQYYLRPLSTQSDRVLYRVEVVIKKDGKFHQRKTVGEGISSQETQGDVFIDLGPYSKTLVLAMNKHE